MYLSSLYLEIACATLSPYYSKARQLPLVPLTSRSQPFLLQDTEVPGSDNRLELMQYDIDF